MQTHMLKTWPMYFEAVLAGVKTFEIRHNDRGFLVGDVLLLAEYDPTSHRYSGREIRKRVTYITDFGQVDRNVVMALGEVTPEATNAAD